MGKIVYTDTPQKTKKIVYQGKFQKGLAAVMKTPERIAPALPLAGSMVGGMIPLSVAGSAVGGVMGRGAGTQLGAEFKQAPLKGLSRIAEGAVPGLSMLTQGLTPEQQGAVGERAVKEAPLELALGVAGGLVGKGLKGLRPMLGKYFTRQADDIVKGLDEIKNVKGAPIWKIVNESADEVADVVKVNSAFDELADTTQAYMRKNARLFGVEFLEDGSLKPTMSNLQKFKEGVGKFMSTKEWAEGGKPTKEAVKKSYKGIRNAMVKVRPDLAPHLDDYHKFMLTTYDDVNRAIRPAGKLRERGARNVLRKGGEETKQAAFESLGKESATAKTAMENVKSATRRIGAKKIGKQQFSRHWPWIPALLGLEAFRRGRD